MCVCVCVCVCVREGREKQREEKKRQPASCWEHYWAPSWSMWLRWLSAERGNWDSGALWSITKRLLLRVQCFRQGFCEGRREQGTGQRRETPDMSLVILQRALSGWRFGVIMQMRHAGSWPKESLNIPEHKHRKLSELDRTHFFGKPG